jgi:hypothetical protein
VDALATHGNAIISAHAKGATTLVDATGEGPAERHGFRAGPAWRPGTRADATFATLSAAAPIGAMTRSTG